jgi:O-antigen ligase
MTHGLSYLKKLKQNNSFILVLYAVTFLLSIVASQGLVLLPPLLFIFCLFYYKEMKFEKLNPSWLFFLTACFLILCTSIFTSKEIKNSSFLVLSNFFILLSAFFYTKIDIDQNRKNNEFVVIVLIFSVFCFILLLVDLNVINFSLLRGEKGKELWSYNRAYVFLALQVPFIFAALNFLGNKNRKFLHFLILVFVTMIVFLSDSESAKLALLVMIFVYFIATLDNENAAIAIFAIIAFLFLVLPFFIVDLTKYLMTTPLWKFKTGVIGARFVLWSMAQEHAMQSPWIGHGIEAMRSVSLYNFEVKEMRREVHPHSMIFQTWIEMGLAGALLFLCGLALTLRRILLCASRDIPYYLSLMCGVLCVLMVSHGIWQSWFIAMSAISFVLLNFVLQKTRHIE